MQRTFATVAKQALAERGLSLRAAARLVNYDVAYLSRVLGGKQLPSAQLARLLDKLVGADGHLASLACAATHDGLSRLVRSLRNPSRIDGKTVEAFADALWSQRQLEDLIGPRAVLPAVREQLTDIKKLAKESRGKHRDDFLSVAGEWFQFTGWLNAALRRDGQATDMLSRAEELADAAGDGTIAAIAVSFKGYVSRQQDRHRGVVRNAMAALHTPGVHPAQVCFDLLQAAQGYAALGERKQSLSLLDDATGLVAQEIEPPPALYWYTTPFFHMNIGMLHWELVS